MKRFIAFMVLCSLVIGTQSTAGHKKYKKYYNDQYVSGNVGCACGH